MAVRIMTLRNMQTQIANEWLVEFQTISGHLSEEAKEQVENITNYSHFNTQQQLVMANDLSLGFAETKDPDMFAEQIREWTREEKERSIVNTGRTSLEAAFQMYRNNTHYRNVSPHSLDSLLEDMKGKLDVE